MDYEIEGKIISAPAGMSGINSMLPEQPRHTSDYSENIFIRRIPFIGRIHFVNDSGGIWTLAFTTFYWIYGTFVSMYIILLPQYNDGHVGIMLPIGFMMISIGCITSLWRAALTNPGRVPLLEDLSMRDTQDWQYCSKCQRKRPSRAHHCRRCQQCVTRMDHHCPWINNCVGQGNHWAFLQLLFYAFCLSWFAFILCMMHFWYFQPCVTCDREAFFVKHSIWFTYLLTAMGVFMGVFMGANFCGQHINLLLDRTTLENIISPPNVQELTLRKEVAAYQDVCGRNPMPCWLFPCRRRPLNSYTRSYSLV